MRGNSPHGLARCAAFDRGDRGVPEVVETDFVAPRKQGAPQVVPNELKSPVTTMRATGGPPYRTLLDTRSGDAAVTGTPMPW